MARPNFAIDPTTVGHLRSLIAGGMMERKYPLLAED